MTSAEHPKGIILIGGGSRSGKSRYAIEYARRLGSPRAFVATAEARDDEMRERIAAHQNDRGPDFTTIEEPLELNRALSDQYAVTVVDCLTLWISNLMASDRDVRTLMTSFLQCAAQTRGAVILVTNEVGCGIVPDNALARAFRDIAGHLNQQAAAIASEAWWMAFGIPLRLK